MLRPTMLSTVGWRTASSGFLARDRRVHYEERPPAWREKEGTSVAVGGAGGGGASLVWRKIAAWAFERGRKISPAHALVTSRMAHTAGGQDKLTMMSVITAGCSVETGSDELQHCRFRLAFM